MLNIVTWILILLSIYELNQNRWLESNTQFDGLVQERRISIAHALELRPSWTNSSKWWLRVVGKHINMFNRSSVFSLLSLTNWNVALSNYHQTFNISCTKFQNLNFLVSFWSCLCLIRWSQLFSREWRCSCSSADRILFLNFPIRMIFLYKDISEQMIGHYWRINEQLPSSMPYLMSVWYLKFLHCWY